MPTSATAQRGRPFTPSSARWQPLGLEQVAITGGFWADLQQLNARTIIDHCERWAEKMGWTGNFDAAAQGRLPGDRRGREFSDSEIYKLLEGMSWEIGRTGNPELNARLLALTARVAAAQEPDGYLNTMFGRPGQGERWSNLEWGHELYCAGHLIQAGVARARTVDDPSTDPLVAVVLRAADQLCKVFGPGGDQRVCGHPEIEVALVELYRVTGEVRYLDQARLFVERRGHGVLGEIDLGQTYFQDDEPVRESTVLRGHAVRALYLASGAVDLAVEDDDDELLAAVRLQMVNTLARRTYLTGGMGAHHEGESFGQDFELPPDRSYSETCAAIASVMANHRLLAQTGDARHADAVERTLYNAVAGAVAEDGTAFYYANTLQQRVPGEVPDPEVARLRASASLRAPWFHVSCCPNNLTRTIASLAAYLATADAEGVQLHQYAPATIAIDLPGGAGRVELEVRTGYPVDGRIEVRVTAAPAQWALTLRVPSWATGATVTDAEGTTAAEPGYVTVTGPEAGGTVQLDLPVAPRWTVADPRVDAVRGQVAVEAGPLVMAMESTDLGGDVGLAEVDASVPPTVGTHGRVVVRTRTLTPLERGWPYLTEDGDAGGELVEFREVPLVAYHAWANRGPSTMRVWLPTR